MSALVVKAICRRIQTRYGSNANAAMAADVSPGVWSNYCSDDHPDTTIPFHRLLMVANATERAAFAKLLAGEPSPPPADLLNEAGETVETAADLHKVVREATKDGVVTPLERKSIRGAALTVIAEATEVLAAAG